MLAVDVPVFAAVAEMFAVVVTGSVLLVSIVSSGVGSAAAIDSRATAVAAAIAAVPAASKRQAA